MYLIAGLGNPGAKYKHTRHNMGFWTIKALAGSLDVRLDNRRFKSRNARATYQDKRILLVRPVTFMNQSGQSVKGCVDFYRIKTDHVLVIHDDIDLPLGRIKIVRNGGAGGHKGIKSIIHCLGSREFPRIKIGVGRPRHGEPIEDYVLSPIYGDEKEMLLEVIAQAVQACKLFISEGIESAMNHINAINFAEKEVTI